MSLTPDRFPHSRLTDVTVARDRSNSFLELDRQRRDFMEDLLSEMRNLELELAEWRARIDRDAFVVVLVDGDGAKFHQDLLRQAQGGSEAASRLHRAIRQYLAHDKDASIHEDVAIIAKVWANLEGLAATLAHDNLISSKNAMSRFAQSFSRSSAGFDFIDVGRGKENADSKMRNMLDFYYHNLQCKKIFFAGCHNSGYVHELKEKELHGQNNRIVLIETTPAEPAFCRLQFPMTKFKDVFHSSFMTNQTRTTTTTRPRTPSSTGTRSQDEDEPRTPFNASHEATWTCALSSEPSIETGSSYSDPVRSDSPQEACKIIVYDHDGNRLDSPIGRKRRNHSARLAYRTKESLVAPLTFCNEHYLARRCKRGSSCPRVHHIPLSNAERGILLQIARTSPCASGPHCQDFDCYQSHHCPNGQKCTRSTSCRFTATKFGSLHHPPDRRAAYRLLEGQSEREIIPP